MKKYLQSNVLAALLALLSCSAYSQEISVSSGASSVDISINSAVEGTLYYSLYNIKLSVLPTALLVKSPNKQNLVRSGGVVISSSERNLDLLRSISNIPENTICYLYTVFEPTNNSIGSVSSFILTLPSRQPAFSYVSKVASTLNRKIDYLLYKPESYLKDKTGRKFPLIVNIHGVLSGTDVNSIKSSGIAAYINGKNDIDFLVASPRNTGWPGNWYSPGTLDEFMAKILADERIDRTKIYLTGLSGGGGGLCYYSAGRASEIAAIVSVCCVNVFLNTDFPYGKNYSLVKDIPLWAFHNSGDGTVTANNSRTLVNDINALNPKPIVPAKLTIYNANGHDAWTATYKNKNIYNWLLGYTKPTPLNKQPVISNDTIVNVIGYGADIILRANANDPDQTGTMTYEWYLLSGGDLTLKGTFSNTLSVADYAPGSYQLRLLVTDGQGARTFKDIVLTITNPVIATDIESSSEELMTTSFVFPNPSTDRIFFRLNQGETVSYKVISMTGELMQEGKSDSVDVSALPRGMYAVETEKGVFKFSKQ